MKSQKTQASEVNGKLAAEILSLPSYMAINAEEFLKSGKVVSPLVVKNINKVNFEKVKEKLIHLFGGNAKTKLFFGDEEEETLLSAATFGKEQEKTLIVFQPPLTERQRHGVESLLEILEVLRNDNGCKWDKEQTNLSLRGSTLEEAYELVDAVTSGNLDDMKEEIGDLLLQGFFHTKIAKDDNRFDYTDVFTTLCHKLISRHTHIFGSDRVSSAEDAISVWEKNKKVEKKFSSATDTLTSVPKSMSALMRACKVCSRASKANFDWREKSGVMSKLSEEIGELTEAIAEGDKTHISEEVGDILFVVCNLCRFLGVEPELALNGTTEKFIKRFARMEELVVSDNLSLSEISDGELDRYYTKAKLQLLEEK